MECAVAFAFCDSGHLLTGAEGRRSGGTGCEEQTLGEIGSVSGDVKSDNPASSVGEPGIQPQCQTHLTGRSCPSAEDLELVWESHEATP